jgi:hypothetical protein
VFILKGFKSFVLEVFIPKTLHARFLEVRIPKDLVKWQTNRTNKSTQMPAKKRLRANLKPPESKNASKGLAATENPILPKSYNSTYYEFVKQNIGGRLGKHL